MKRLFSKFFLFLVFFLIGLSGLQAERKNGYPSDFFNSYDLTDDGGRGRGNGIGLFGFGGLDALQIENQRSCKHIPVILLHGNGTDYNGTLDCNIEGKKVQGNMMKISDLLKKHGYNDSEIWAVSYLGTYGEEMDCSFIYNGTCPELYNDFDMVNPYRNNIENVRKFIDAIIDYLGVKRVIIIGYSLGAGMARAYLNGLIKTNSGLGYAFESSLTRYDKVAALITIAGANYGFGLNYAGCNFEDMGCEEFRTACNFEHDSHFCNVASSRIYDDTPYGAPNYVTENVKLNELAGISLPPPYDIIPFSCTSQLDGKFENRIFYCGISSKDDMLNKQCQKTSFLEGADCNKEYTCPDSYYSSSNALWWKSCYSSHGTDPAYDYYAVQRHLYIINDETVFNESILPIITHANLYYPHNNPLNNIPTRWLAGFFSATSAKIRHSYNDLYHNLFAVVTDNPEKVLSYLENLYIYTLMYCPPQNIENLPQEYTDLSIWLNSFGVNMGDQYKNSMDPSLHLNWAKSVNWQELYRETCNRLSKILHTPDISKDNHDFLTMWYASESIFLRNNCDFGNPWANSNDPSVHYNWALSKSKDELINEILKKYELAINYIIEKANEEGTNAHLILLKFYAESAERLAMWGARYVIESEYDYESRDPEPADFLTFELQALWWEELKIRRDLNYRIATVAEFLCH